MTIHCIIATLAPRDYSKIYIYIAYNLQHWLVLISLENFPEQGRVNKVSCCYSVKLHRTSDIPVMEPCSDAYPASLEDKPIFLLSKVKKEQNEVANWLL